MTPPARAQLLDPFGVTPSPPGASVSLGQNSGVLPCQWIRVLAERKQVYSDMAPFTADQIQPASLDLRLGSKAIRVRASFLPGKGHKVRDKLDVLEQHVICLDDGAVLERNCVYLVELQEALNLPESIAGVANPKSSTGRLDVFTRVITDHAEIFDSVPAGYSGPLYVEISPRTFSIRVRKGSRLNQLRFRRRNSMQHVNKNFRLTDRQLRELHADQQLVANGEASIRDGLQIRVGLDSDAFGFVGYRARHHTDIIDVDNVDGYDPARFWERVAADPDGRLVLDPNEFYILASKEAVHVPPDFSAEMVPIDTMMGEFRVHYAGFFDPGFGHQATGGAGSRAVLEVRSYEVPFILEDGQIIGRLAYERLTDRPETLYGAGIGSHYQAQGLKLSKHFRRDV